VKVSTLRTATAASLPVLAGMLRKKWIARETTAVERDARRTERFAVLIPEARLPSLTEKQQAILAELAACDGELPLAELRKKELPSSTLQTLVRRGLVRIEERAAAFRMGGLRPARAPFKLNEPQMEALAGLATSLGGFHSFLLFGVTGSGKTAVYLAAMQRALDKGMSSILLVPEIGLTPQTVGLTRRSAIAWLCCTPRSRRKSAASSGGASGAAMRRLLWALARRSSPRRPISASSWWTKSTTRAISRKRRRATTRAMWP
jgi:primosomal protein N' (replication factor Y)